MIGEVPDEDGALFADLAGREEASAGGEGEAREGADGGGQAVLEEMGLGIGFGVEEDHDGARRVGKRVGLGGVRGQTRRAQGGETVHGGEAEGEGREGRRGVHHESFRGLRRNNKYLMGDSE